MIQIRRGLFETNSSSTHTLVIDKGSLETKVKRIVFDTGEYGWEFDVVKDTQRYFWSLVLCTIQSLSPSDIDPKNEFKHENAPMSELEKIELIIKRLTKIFNEQGIETEFIVPMSLDICDDYIEDRNNELENLDTSIITDYNASIDHGPDAITFIIDLFKDPELLLKFCCNSGSEVITGNDNESIEDMGVVFKEYERVLNDKSGRYGIYHK